MANKDTYATMVNMVNRITWVAYCKVFIYRAFQHTPMPRKASETIRVTPENWQRLNGLKEPGESFDDVITRLLEEDQNSDDESGKRNPATPVPS